MLKIHFSFYLKGAGDGLLCQPLPSLPATISPTLLKECRWVYFKDVTAESRLNQY